MWVWEAECSVGMWIDPGSVARACRAEEDHLASVGSGLAESAVDCLVGSVGEVALRVVGMFSTSVVQVGRVVASVLSSGKYGCRRA